MQHGCRVIPLYIFALRFDRLIVFLRPLSLARVIIKFPFRFATLNRKALYLSLYLSMEENVLVELLLFFLVNLFHYTKSLIISII